MLIMSGRATILTIYNKTINYQFELLNTSINSTPQQQTFVILLTTVKRDILVEKLL